MTAERLSKLHDDACGRELEIIFSSRDGYVWASWPDTDLSLKLGRHDMVAAMMENFLAQDALGKRLEKRSSGS